MNDLMVELKDLSYKYISIDEDKQVERYAVKDVNLQVKKGEFLVVLGHNGSGKSTIAKHINALVNPSSGVVLVDGMDTSDSKNIWKVRSKAGMVFQNPDNQMVATIVEEDVAFGPENLGVDPKEIRERVDRSLEIVGMLEYKKHAPHLLSGGQKQRIAIAGVLAMNPECIVFDEPTAMLDPSGRKDVMKNIQMLNKEQGITIILITHYMDEAALADRVVVVDDGKVVREGTPREVFSNVKQMKEIGLDVPQVTELAYDLKNSGIKISTEILNVDEMVSALCQLK